MVSARKKLVLWWRRTGMAARAGIFFAGVALFSLLIYLQRPQQELEFAQSNLFVFLLVNVNIVILCVLAILVGRNIVKLIFDRRKNIFGSKLKSKLVLAFVGLTLIPTAILFFTASGLLSRAMDGWFSNQVGAAVTGAVDVARNHFSYLENNTLRTAFELSAEMGGNPNLYEFEASVEPFLEAERKRLGLFSISLVDFDNASVLRVQSAAALVEDFDVPESSMESMKKAFSGEAHVSLEERGASQFVRAYQPAHVLGQDLVLLVTHRVDPMLSESMRAVNYSYKEYEQLKLFRNPVRSGYLLTLGMITILILFAAIWIGFYVAREIVIPIQRLAEGTRAVAKGNLDFHIRPTGDDEISSLVSSFNTMTSDLKDSRKQAEQRQSYIEAILTNLAVGVIACDAEKKITAVNQAALKILGFKSQDEVLGRKGEEVFKELGLDKVSSLIETTSGKSASRPLEFEFDASTEMGARRLLVTAGQIPELGGRTEGVLLIFDDITELSKAQHASAWREVARRIAHEIKNPLTPIQLSAQRLEKLLSGTDFAPAVKESANTIVEYVDSIKRLANEFTQFARMPTADFVLSDLNLLLSETMSEFADNNPDIRFQFIAGSRLPNNYMDRDQIRRCFINIIDNAIVALRSDRNVDGLKNAKITVRTSHDQSAQSVSFEVIDNGPGIDDSSKIKIFEPYFTTSKGGTGLGLAIVRSIIDDHQADISVLNNPPKGVRFVVKLPINPQPVTQRKLAGGLGGV